MLEERTVVVLVAVFVVVVGVLDPLLRGYLRPVEPQVPALGASDYRLSWVTISVQIVLTY